MLRVIMSIGIQNCNLTFAFVSRILFNSTIPNTRKKPYYSNIMNFPNDLP